MTVFPARAGMSRIDQQCAAIPPGVPRASGDEPQKLASDAIEWMCSPRERG